MALTIRPPGPVRAGFPVLLALVFTACGVAPPRAMVEADFGVVRADTRAEAEAVSRTSIELLPRLRRLVPALREREVEVWVQEQIEVERGSPYPSHIAGMADSGSGRVHLRRNDENLELHLAHELVHVLLDESWEPLPGMLEEGVCDLAAAAVADRGGAEHHAKRLVEAAAFFGGMDAVVELRLPGEGGRVHRHRIGGLRRIRTISHRLKMTFDRLTERSVAEMLELDDTAVFEMATEDDGMGLYGLGYVFAVAIVDRIGFQGLHQLCSRGLDTDREQVDPALILAAAGAGEAGEKLPGIVRELLAGSDPEVLASVLGDGVSEAVAELARERFAGPEHLIRVGEPRLRFSMHRRRVSLGDVESFREGLAEHW